MQFLNGLNEQCSNVQSHMNIPTMAKKISDVSQQEMELNESFIQNEVKVNNTNFSNSVNHTYKFCGRIGHTKAVCCRKHDFPNQENKNTKGEKVCVHCGKSGHMDNICYKKHGFPLGYKFNNSKNSFNSIETV